MKWRVQKLHSKLWLIFLVFHTVLEISLEICFCNDGTVIRQAGNIINNICCLKLELFDSHDTIVPGQSFASFKTMSQDMGNFQAAVYCNLGVPAPQRSKFHQIHNQAYKMILQP